MNESILESIKTLLGIDSSYTHFDPDLIMHINNVFFTLKQLGVRKTSFNITDASQTWGDYTSDIENLEAIKIYVYLKVKLLFDPPASGILNEAMNNQIRETEWRINVEVDND